MSVRTLNVLTLDVHGQKGGATGQWVRSPLGETSSPVPGLRHAARARDAAEGSALRRVLGGALKAALPIRRFGAVEEVAPTVDFLASDEASYYVGQTLGPNGGDVML